MALFGKSDARIPVLTAFYQAEIDKKNLIGSELDTLIYRYICHEPHSLCLWSDTREESRETLERALQIVATKQRLLVHLMNAAADKETPDTIQSDVRNLNSLINQFLTPPQLGWAHDIDRTGFFYVRYQDNPFVYDKGKEPLEDTLLFLGMLLANFVRAADRESFMRCIECQSVFTALRKPARFCSERCRARHGERRRRKEKTLVSIDKINTNAIMTTDA